MKRMSSLVVVLVALAALSPARAFAQPLTPKREDVTTLEKVLADESAALSTSDCTVACRALASIRRAADKICALEPGDRCTAAHAKADDATRRVRDACPDCAIAAAPLAPRKQADEPAMAPKAAPKEPAPAPGVESVSSAPPSESRRGGCAGCTSSPASPADVGLTALAVVALGLVLRRRRP